MPISHKYDFLIIGSGSAGLTFALEVAEYGSVAIITKKEKHEANTRYAQGGIASVLSRNDSFEKHIEDTLEAGAGLCNRDAVELVVREGPRVIEQLQTLGARFTTDNGSLDLTREGGHSHDRIVHAADMTGEEVERVLVEQVSSHSKIDLFEHHFAVDLLTEHHLGRYVSRYDDINCYGAYVLNVQSGKVERLLARATLLATGGAGQVYQHTTNPSIATGDGIAMAYRAKARIANMEFIQFHPTSLYHPEADSFLISEAVRGHGGILINEEGHRFMEDYDERGELAPRDIVARAIDDQLKKRGDDCVYLDISHQERATLKKQFPMIYETCFTHGIEMDKQPIPVVPAAHYICGGVITDLEGKTSIQGLFAAGEVAHTGVHGANRLASNSILEALVFAKRSAQSAKDYIQNADYQTRIPEWDESGTANPEEWVLISHNKRELKQVMGDYVGIVRSDLRLTRARRRIRLLHEEVEDFYQRTKVSVPLCELRNLIIVGDLIVQSALQRRESRGLHYTTDYRHTIKSAQHDTII